MNQQQQQPSSTTSSSTTTETTITTPVNEESINLQQGGGAQSKHLHTCCALLRLVEQKVANIPAIICKLVVPSCQMINIQEKEGYYLVEEVGMANVNLSAEAGMDFTPTRGIYGFRKKWQPFLAQPGYEYIRVYMKEKHTLKSLTRVGLQEGRLVKKNGFSSFYILYVPEALVKKATPKIASSSSTTTTTQLSLQDTMRKSNILTSPATQSNTLNSINLHQHILYLEQSLNSCHQMIASQQATINQQSMVIQYCYLNHTTIHTTPNQQQQQQQQQVFYEEEEEEEEEDDDEDDDDEEEEEEE